MRSREILRPKNEHVVLDILKIVGGHGSGGFEPSQDRLWLLLKALEMAPRS